VRRGFDRTGTVLSCNVREGNGCGASRLAGRDPRNRSVAGVLEKSKAGIYSQFEVQRGLPIQLLVKYFKQQGELWQINAEIRTMVQHRQLNLLHDFSQLGVFDVIFCRNVLIYFDQQTKVNIFNRLAKAIAPDGYFVLGAAESVVGLTDVFHPCRDRRGLYRPRQTAASSAESATPKMPALKTAGLAML
jgi:chemotaxis protein methyltransferase CheR